MINSPHHIQANSADTVFMETHFFRMRFRQQKVKVLQYIFVTVSPYLKHNDFA